MADTPDPTKNTNYGEFVSKVMDASDGIVASQNDVIAPTSKVVREKVYDQIQRISQDVAITAPDLLRVLALARQEGVTLEYEGTVDIRTEEGMVPMSVKLEGGRSYGTMIVEDSLSLSKEEARAALGGRYKGWKEHRLHGKGKTVPVREHSISVKGHFNKEDDSTRTRTPFLETRVRMLIYMRDPVGTHNFEPFVAYEIMGANYEQIRGVSFSPQKGYATFRSNAPSRSPYRYHPHNKNKGPSRRTEFANPFIEAYMQQVEEDRQTIPALGNGMRVLAAIPRLMGEAAQALQADVQQRAGGMKDLEEEVLNDIVVTPFDLE